jgi:hypothetical protein
MSFAEQRREAAKRKAQEQRTEKQNRKADRGWWYPPNWNWTALATCVIALFTVLLFFTALYQWLTFRGQLKVMQRQVTIQELDERPWLALQIIPNGDLQFTRDGIPYLPVHVTIKNVGRTPAIDIGYSISLAPATGEIFDIGAFKEKERCISESKMAENVQADAPGIRQILLPTDTIEEDRSAPIQRQDYPTANYNRPKSPPNPGTFYVFSASLVGCVHYKFVGGDTLHGTGKEYELMQITPENPDGEPFFDFGRQVDRQKLILGGKLTGNYSF